MKKILALTISSLVMTGAYAEPVRAKTTEQRVVVIDDSNRKAILSALGTSDEEAHAVAALSPTPVEQPKPKVKTETVSQSVTQTKEKVVSIVTPAPVEKKPIKAPEVIKTETKVAVLTEKKSDPVMKEVKAPVVKATLVKTEILPVAKTPKIEQPIEIKKEFVPILPLVTNTEEKCACKTAKKPVKYLAHKKVIKKIVKKTKVVKQIKEFDLVKPPYSVSQPPYGTTVVTYLTNNDVSSNLTYLKERKLLTLSISNVNGQHVMPEDFITRDNNAQISAYLMNSDLSNMEKQNIYIADDRKDYQLNIANFMCKALFVKYQLKGSTEQHTLVKYFDKQGNMSFNVDNQCPSVNANIQDNLTYSNENYTTGIFLNNASLSAEYPLAYSVIVNRNGQSFIPGTLKSFIVNKDLSQFHEVKPVSKASLGISGATYSQKLDSGVYYVVAQFPGVKKEQGITVEVNIH